MRRSIVLTLASLVAAAPLAAQFEGTVTMKMSMPGGQGMSDVISKTAMSMSGGAGPMAGMEMRSIYDPASNTMTVLMPMPAQMAQMPGMAGAGMITALEMLLNHRDVTLQDVDVVAAAVRQYRKKPTLGFSACLMLEVARKAGHLPFGTFDRELARLDGAQRL